MGPGQIAANRDLAMQAAQQHALSQSVRPSLPAMPPPAPNPLSTAAGSAGAPLGPQGMSRCVVQQAVLPQSNSIHRGFFDK